MKTLTNETYIYSLSNEDDVIRYIGKSNNLKDRLSEHINESKKGVNTRKNRWILPSLNNDKTIKIKIIDIAKLQYTRDFMAINPYFHLSALICLKLIVTWACLPTAPHLILSSPPWTRSSAVLRRVDLPLSS